MPSHVLVFIKKSVLRQSSWSIVCLLGVAYFAGWVQGVRAVQYNPQAQMEVKVMEVDFRKNEKGRQLKALVYQPQGKGPFPVILDLHGGAWNHKDRRAERPMDFALAKSGLLVVAIDLTLGPEAPYPANIQDANYGVRWLKYHAKDWNGDASHIGIYGSSTGGHIAQLLALRPNDPRYNAIAFPQAPQLDAKVAFVATRSPISNPFARYENAVSKKREEMINNHLVYFKPWEAIHEASPQEILDRKEAVSLVPLLIMHGEKDDNVPPEAQKIFAQTYQAAGGEVQLLFFKDSEHEWVAKEGPQTDKARETVKAFIAKQLQP